MYVILLLRYLALHRWVLTQMRRTPSPRSKRSTEPALLGNGFAGLAEAAQHPRTWTSGDLPLGELLPVPSRADSAGRDSFDLK
jgi:hypothetical protein